MPRSTTALLGASRPSRYPLHDMVFSRMAVTALFYFLLEPKNHIHLTTNFKSLVQILVGLIGVVLVASSKEMQCFAADHSCYIWRFATFQLMEFWILLMWVGWRQWSTVFFFAFFLGGEISEGCRDRVVSFCCLFVRDGLQYKDLAISENWFAKVLLPSFSQLVASNQSNTWRWTHNQRHELVAPTDLLEHCMVHAWFVRHELDARFIAVTRDSTGVATACRACVIHRYVDILTTQSRYRHFPAKPKLPQSQLYNGRRRLRGAPWRDLQNLLR